MAQLFTSLLAGLALFTLMRPLAYLPKAVLAAVVFTIATRLVRPHDLKAIFAAKTDEGIIALVTAVCVVALGVQNGILISAALCLINHVRRGYDPKNYLLSQDDTGWQVHPVADLVALRPGPYCYRFEAPLYYANATKFQEEVTTLADQPGCTGVICDFSAIADVDYSAGQDLLTLARFLSISDVQLYVTHVTDHVSEQLTRYGLFEHHNVSLHQNTKLVLAAIDEEASSGYLPGHA
jgi:MFS superfamily sulfate permease-like transporter